MAIQSQEQQDAMQTLASELSTAKVLHVAHVACDLTSETPTRLDPAPRAWLAHLCPSSGDTPQ